MNRSLAGRASVLTAVFGSAGARLVAGRRSAAAVRPGRSSACWTIPRPCAAVAARRRRPCRSFRLNGYTMPKAAGGGAVPRLAMVPPAARLGQVAESDARKALFPAQPAAPCLAGQRGDRPYPQTGGRRAGCAVGRPSGRHRCGVAGTGGGAGMAPTPPTTRTSCGASTRCRRAWCWHRPLRKAAGAPACPRCQRAVRPAGLGRQGARPGAERCREKELPGPRLSRSSERRAAPTCTISAATAPIRDLRARRARARAIGTAANAIDLTGTLIAYSEEGPAYVMRCAADQEQRPRGAGPTSAG